METSKIDLTATEMGYLWQTYRAQTMNFCVLTYFQSICEDENIRELNQKNLDANQFFIREMENIFKEDQIPIPEGFSIESDVILTGEKLYTDPFILLYHWFVVKGNLSFGANAINTIAREDVFSFFTKYLADSLELLGDARRILLEKGLWTRAPYIPKPTKVEYIKKESFLNGWFGDTRPMIGVEIASSFYNLLTNSIGESMISSFIQVTKSEELKDYFIRGKEISLKHMEVLSKLLKEEELPAGTTWNSGVTASTAAPFSEKLMLSMVTFLNAQGLSNYGVAGATAIRKDIGVNFARLGAEVGNYAVDGASLLIEKGWMEAPPHAPKHK